MANEAYRAVFIRVHPTGKVVLSLTTEAAGNEPQFAQIVAEELGIPPLDVKVVETDTNRFGVGHGYNAAPSDGTPAAIHNACAKILAKGRLLAGMALDAPADSLTWDRGAWMSDGDAASAKTLEDVALYAHGTGELPPGVEGGLDGQTTYLD